MIFESDKSVLIIIFLKYEDMKFMVFNSCILNNKFFPMIIYFSGTVVDFTF